MRTFYRVRFREIFLVALCHLLALAFFFFAKTPSHSPHKPLIVKSFSIPAPLLQEQKPVAKVYQTPPLSLLETPNTTPTIEKKEADLPKPSPKKEPLVEKKLAVPAVEKKAKPPVQKKIATLEKKPTYKAPPEPVRKNLQKKPVEKAHRTGERPKISHKEEKIAEGKVVLQREYHSLVKALEKNNSSLQTPLLPKNSKHDISVPTIISSASVEAKVENSSFSLSQSSQYTDLLVQDLKNNLQLPDYGEIRLRMRISANGSVIQVEVLTAKSERNKLYLQKELPKIQFLWFPNLLSGAAFYDFVITFQNENF